MTNEEKAKQLDNLIQDTINVILISKLQEFLNYHFEVFDNPLGKYVATTDYESIDEIINGFKDYIK